MTSPSSLRTFNEIKLAVDDLISNGLTDSADKLCSLVLSSSVEFPLNNNEKSLMLELYGDSIFANKEYRRALQQYRLAAQPRALIDTGTDSSANASTFHRISNSSRSHQSATSIITSEQARLRFKECQCHLQLEDLTIAMRELEAIPLALRDVPVNVCLGKLYKNAGLRRHAVTTVLVFLSLSSSLRFSLWP